MKYFETLSSIAQYLELTDIEAELNAIKYRAQQENANIVLPLIGEFSSGKTTLINALTDCKKLETATKPTTATIYEVHFGCDVCHATILNEESDHIEVSNIEDLKNETLADAKVVTVFDTSTKIPSTTILVDTPGLSSPDPKHRQTLVDFLPKADGILLVIDINQQITRSLTDFIETMKLSQKTIFLILTKSDTKSEQDIEAAKASIRKESQIPFEQMAAVSAHSNKMEELYSLLDNIQKNKKEIIKQVDSLKLKNIAKYLINYIDELIKSSSSDDDLEKAIRECKYELEKINRNIVSLVESMSDDIKEQEKSISRKFEDDITLKLDNLVTGKSKNLDAEAVSIINNTATLLLNKYKTGIQTILSEKALSQRGTDNELKLNSLNNLNLSEMQISGLSYNLDLASMGHKYDKMIKNGLIAATTVATVALTAGATGVAVARSAASTVASKAIDIIDTASDVGSIISNRRTVDRIRKTVSLASKTADQYNIIDRNLTANTNMIDSFIGSITEKMLSKPQRKRAIRDYIENSLAPDFKEKLNNISDDLVSSIRFNLQEEASQMIEQKTKTLNQLKSEYKEKKDKFDERILQLRKYKSLLMTL